MFTPDPSWREPRARVFRIDDRTQKWTIHGWYALDELTESLIGELFGGGKYVGQVVALSDRGKQDIVARHRFNVPGPYKPPIKDLPGMTPATAPSPAPTVEGTYGGRVPPGMTPNEVVSAAMVTQLLDLIDKRGRGGDAAAAPAWLEPLVKLGIPLIERLIERKPDDTEKRLLLAKLEKLESDLTALRTQPGPAASGIKDAVEAVKSLIGVKNLLEGNEPPDPDTMMWSGFTKLVEAATAQKGQPALQPGQPTVPQPAMPLWQQLVLRNKTLLLNAATRGQDPDDVAELAARFLPEHVMGVALELVQQPNAVGLVFQAVPELQQFPAWTERFMLAFRDALVEPEEAETETGEEGTEVAG